MNKITVLNNLITNDDMQMAIELIDKLVENGGANSVVGYSEDPQSEIQHARHVFTDPDYPEVGYLVKKYHAKIAESEPKYVNTFPHSVILVRYDIGGELELHNDFENYDPCSQCTHANAMYLNDEYEGGEIYFPEVGFQVKPPAGSIVYFPQTNVNEDHSDMTHGVTPITSGTKYLINFCITTNKDLIVPVLR